MSLENLVKINKLNPHVSNAAEVARLLAAAQRNVADSTAAGISDETRFDAAYKAIMQCAVIGLYGHGYRPSTTTPGHHQAKILLTTTTSWLRANRPDLLADKK